ncbi:M48 family metalloprotease [Couchioplanes caeruleus]|uniref:M48 family metalloprotease n=1 Tax=Couchioplanes caeruleus TaxID=56438 RepID=UPI00201C37AB|nr:M48 family metalloprotease [Couchioplanes caeruleus]UQU67621.1 M48 family metalloprotease [Couchioplanes caeruleus]
MTVAIYVPLLLALTLAASARWIAARGTPGPAARALTAIAAITAAASTWSLALLALTMLDDLPPLAALDDHATVELPEPVPGPVALVAGLAMLAGGVRLWLDVRRRSTTHRQLRAAGTARQGLVVADWSAPLAVAVPGLPGRDGHLLVTTGILRLLDAEERRVVLAHEQAHLAHAHHRIVAVAAAAAALNPLLIPVRETVAYLVERWADEAAAAAVGDRDLTAQAVARAALATLGPGPAAALGIHGSAAVHRVQALTEPTPAPRRRRLIGPVLLGSGCVTAIIVATVEFVALARAWL